MAAAERNRSARTSVDPSLQRGDPVDTPIGVLVSYAVPFVGNTLTGWFVVVPEVFSAAIGRSTACQRRPLIQSQAWRSRA